MNGFENIAANNGWVMAVTGAGIVFCGLAALSLVISLIGRLFIRLEGRPADAKPAAEKPAAEAPGPPPGADPHCHSLEDIREVAHLYQPLVEPLGESFELAALHRLANENDFPHPHLTISCMRDARILLPQGDGTFRWNLEENEA
ncbi:MAG: OadG family protein [Desulfobacteraceae bacterium]|nr:OadG family protein [Desulfobacteraceae bacterium]